MVTMAVGALLGWAFSGALIGWGIVTTAFGAIMLGASLGSLFVSREMGDFSSSPTYSFGPISNTMSQLVPIPVIYGKCRVAGNIIYQAFADDKKEVQDLYILVGEGPVTAINSVMANDQDPTALEDCSLTTYLNTTAATHDGRDPSGARPYPDDVALICLTLKAQEKLNGTPTVTSIIDGVKVWTPGGFAWSRNPVWIVLDILCHPRYGLGYGAVTNGVYQHPDWDKIDYACAVAAAAYCDGTVSYGPRFQLDFTLDTQRPIRDVLADFLASCRGYMVETDKLQICIDAPVSIYSREITPDNIVEGSFTFWQAADEDVCNRITIDWIDPNNSYERVTDVFQDSTDIADRGVVEKSISLLPVTRAEQVGHMGYYLLKTSLLVRNFCSFGVGLKDCDIQPGEVLQVTFESFAGWNKKPFRVVSVKNSGQDVMTVTCSEYIADVYDDSVLDITHHIDTSLDTNYKPDDVTDMAITEQLETLQDGSYNLIAKISWTPPASYSSLELWYRYSSEVSWKPAGTFPRGSEEYYLPCTEKIGDTLYVKIYVVSRLGVRSDGQTTSKILRGDLTPPAAPTNLQGKGGFRLAHIKWTDPPDGDLDHIDVYRSFTADDAEDFTKIGIAPRFAQEYIDNGLGVLQTAWYKLKAVDVAGNESVFSDVVSATGESLPAQEIPEASIDESKLLPSLADKITSVDNSDTAISLILNAIEEDRNAKSRATIQQVSQIVRGENGLEAQWYVKTDVNGRIAGFGLFNSGSTSEFAVLAKHFFIAKDDGTATPVFEVNSETGLVQIIGDLIASGSITGDKINAAAQIQLGAGGALIMGDGSILQMGSGAIILDSEAGVLQIRDPNNLTTGNYVRVDTGDITTYQYIGGAYRAMKSLRKMEVGVGNNGATVTLPGYWPSQPKIQVSPNALQCYNASYPNQSQQLRCYADSIAYNNGVVTFVPRAYLEIAAGGNNVSLPVAVINHNIYPDAGGGDNIPLTVQTSSYAVPSGAKNVVVTVKVYAQQAGGAIGDRVLMKNLKADVKVVFAGATTNIGTVNIPATNYNLSTEPTSYYKTVSITLPGGYSSAQNLYVSAYLYYAGSNSEMQWIYTFAQMDRFWLRLDSLQWSLSGSTQLAEGTLNYVAIAE